MPDQEFLRADALGEAVRAYDRLRQGGEQIIDALTAAATVAPDVLATAGIDPRFISLNAALPRVPTSAELATVPLTQVLAGSHQPGGMLQRLRWDRGQAAWLPDGEALVGATRLEAVKEDVAAADTKAAALQHASLEDMLSSTSPAFRHQAAGRRGGAFVLMSPGTPVPTHAQGLEAMYHVRADGRVLRRVTQPGDLLDVGWWPISFGPQYNGADSDQVNAARLAAEQAAVDKWVAYATTIGGQFVMPYGAVLEAHIRSLGAAKPITVVAYNAEVWGTDKFKPVVTFENFDEVRVIGMKAKHTSVGTAPPLSHQDPRRTAGGHGFLFVRGAFLHTTGLDVLGAASMGMVTWAVKIFHHDSPTVRLCMGDGIHTTGGCEQGTINSPIVRYCGDDGIPVVSYKPSAQSGDAVTGAAGLCRNVTVNNGSVMYAGARGLTVAGGEHIVYNGLIVENTWTYGVFIAEDRGFETYAPKNITLNGGIIANAGRYSPAGDAPVSSGVYVDQAATDVTIGGGLQVYGATLHGLQLEGANVTVGHVDVHHNAGVGAFVTGDHVIVGADAVLRSNAGAGYLNQRRPKLAVRPLQTTTIDGTPITRAEEYQQTDGNGNLLWLLPQDPVFRGTSRGHTVGVAAYAGAPLRVIGADVTDNTIGLEAGANGVIRMSAGRLARNSEGVAAHDGGRISLSGVDVEESGGYGLQAYAGGVINVQGGHIRANGQTPGAVNVQAVVHGAGSELRLVGTRVTGTLPAGLGAFNAGKLKVLGCDLEEASAANGPATVDYGGDPVIQVSGSLPLTANSTA